MDPKSLTFLLFFLLKSPHVSMKKKRPRINKGPQIEKKKINFMVTLKVFIWVYILINHPVLSPGAFWSIALGSGVFKRFWGVIFFFAFDTRGELRTRGFVQNPQRISV